MTCTWTPRCKAFQARSVVTTGKRRWRPKAIHARSPSDSPPDRVLARNLATSRAIVSSNGQSNKAFPRTPCLTSFNRTESGLCPRSANFVSTSAQFKTLITATLSRASSAANAPGSSLNQAKSADASSTAVGTFTYVILCGLLAGVPESALQTECVLGRLRQTSPWLWRAAVAGSIGASPHSFRQSTRVAHRS
jgi:hypothetical protein